MYVIVRTFDGSRNRCEIAWKIYCMEIAVDMFPENAGNLQIIRYACKAQYYLYFWKFMYIPLMAPGIAGR